MTVSVDVLTDSERPSENPESWREGEREGKSRGGSFVFIREGAPAERGNAGIRAANCGIASRISGKLFFAVNAGGEGLDSAACGALYHMYCGWLVPNAFAMSSPEETELSGVGK